MARVAMVVSNAFMPDPRVYKEAKSLVGHGFKVTVYAWDRECKYPKNEVVDEIVVKRVHVRSKYGNCFMFMVTAPIFWVLALLRILVEGADTIHCHDFDTVPVGVLVKVLTQNTKMAYDAHEYYPAMVVDQIPKVLHALLVWVDKVFMRIADCVIIPCEERKRFYAGAKNLIVVPNTPKLVDVPMRAKQKEFSVFYGGGLSKENGILVMVNAMIGIQYAKLILAGDGPLRHVIERISEKKDNIKYLGFISQREVLENLACADATFVFYEPTNINKVYSASNKLFEAMMVGVPVVVNEETKPSKMVKEYDCGVVVPYGDIQALRREIIRLESDPSLRKRLGRNGKKVFREKFAWDLVELDFVNEYKLLLK